MMAQPQAAKQTGGVTMPGTQPTQVELMQRLQQLHSQAQPLLQEIACIEAQVQSTQPWLMGVANFPQHITQDTTASPPIAKRIARTDGGGAVDVHVVTGQDLRYLISVDEARKALDEAQKRRVEGEDQDRSTEEGFVANLLVVDNLIQLCFGSEIGSKLVQAYIESTRRPVDYQEIARILSSFVRAAWADEHANFVLTTLIDNGDPVALQFIATALQGKAVECAQNKKGCRSLIKLIEEDRSGVDLTQIIAELEARGRVLISHPSGHLVIKEMLEYSEHQRTVSVVTSYLLENLHDFARHKHASQVIEKVLDKAAVLNPIDKWKIELALAVQAVELSKDRFGCHVILHILRDDTDFTMENVRRAEMDGGETRRALFRDSGILAACQEAGLGRAPTPEEDLPRDIIVDLLTTEMSIGALRAEKFAKDIVDVLDEMRRIAAQQDASSQRTPP